MDIPDCYDPVRQAERREAEWDREMEILPRCALCGEIRYPGNRIHKACGRIVCGYCFDTLMENEDIVELED